MDEIRRLDRWEATQILVGQLGEGLKAGQPPADRVAVGFGIGLNAEVRDRAELGLQRSIYCMVSVHKRLHAPRSQLANDVAADIGVMADIVAQTGIEVEETHDLLAPA
jgi:hypothetical protein